MGEQNKPVCSICQQELSLFERMAAYHNGDSYVCHGCCSALCRAAGVVPFQDFRLSKFIAKVFFGVMFVGATAHHNTISMAIASAVIGLLLIGWAVVPVLLEKSRCNSIVARELVARKAAGNVLRRCKMCGAVSQGSFCEYCGTPLEMNRP